MAKKTIDKKLLMALYDDNHGVNLTVNATEPDVNLPERFRNETKLNLVVSRDTTASIYFNESSVKATLKFEEGEIECEVPYAFIRDVYPIKKPDDAFWSTRGQEKKKKERFSKLIEISAWALGVIGAGSAYYAYTHDISYFDYSMYEFTKHLWNSESYYFSAKIFSIWVAMLETFWVVMAAPIALLGQFYSLPPILDELLLLAVFFMIGGIAKLKDDLDDNPQEPSLTELNLELLGLRPIFKKKEFNIKSDFCFYVGPFSEEFSNLYKQHVYTPLTSNGLQINRADEIFGTRPVMDDVWECINEASIIIAEVSGRNPNVMYEVGMAHTIGKKVIIITQDLKDVPFDLQHYRYVIYDNNEEGLKELENKLINTVKRELGMNKKF